MCIRTSDKKQTKNEHLKENHRKQNILLETVQRLRYESLYCIRKYFIIWDVQPYSAT